jgi:hypothetical protein
MGGSKELEDKISVNEREVYTHEEYRSAGVAHLMNLEQECEFYYRGKPIAREQADEMVKMYRKRKQEVKK